MAKATAICTCEKCGEQFKVVKACYNRKEANEFEAWAERSITECNECKRKRKDAEREAENQKAAALAKNRKPLSGSQKQIAWAISIREKFLATLSDKLAAEKAPDFLQWLVETKDSASWWIDHRDSHWVNLVEETYREYLKTNQQKG